MHLCDWVLLATAAALWWDWQLGFELGYFWGLAGTLQALFTPAIDPDLAWWRLGVFFFVHALIVTSVLHLMLTERLRPTWRSLLRVFVCSEIYVLVALAVNAWTGGNYGFLTHRPAQASLLDAFSDTPWLYVLQINVIGLALFPGCSICRGGSRISGGARCRFGADQTARGATSLQRAVCKAHRLSRCIPT